MIERLVESWLTKANERSYQTPFCHCLLKEGYRVVHLTRHTGMEMGKDIIAVDPDGTPCAFQLKSAPSGKINLTTWRNEIQPQLLDLVDGAINHPSVDPNSRHKSFIVINGEFEEEVLRSISDFNSEPTRRNDQFRQINTIVKGELLLKFKQLGTDFCPPNYFDNKILLRLIVNSGKEELPKEDLSRILSQLLFPEMHTTNADCGRRITAAAIITSFAISSYAAEDNYCAELEGWVLYASYVLAIAEKQNLEGIHWEANFNLAIDTIYDLLDSVCCELERRGENLTMGHPISDKIIENVRLTYLVGLMSCYGLWRKGNGLKDKTDDFIRLFCTNNMRKLMLWGEYAAPQMLSIFLFFKAVDGTLRSDYFLRSCIETIISYSKSKNPFFLASPYYKSNEIMSRILGINSDLINDNFKGNSFVLEGLMQLYVRLNWKQEMKFLWPDISRFHFREFQPNNLWEYYLWHCEKGNNVTVIPPMTKKWSDLRQEADESDGSEIPRIMKISPCFYLCFLITFPHRWNSSGVRWLERVLNEL